MQRHRPLALTAGGTQLDDSPRAFSAQAESEGIPQRGKM